MTAKLTLTEISKAITTYNLPRGEATQVHLGAQAIKETIELIEADGYEVTGYWGETSCNPFGEATGCFTTITFKKDGEEYQVLCPANYRSGSFYPYY